MLKKIRKLNLGTQRLLLILSLIIGLLISYIIDPSHFMEFDNINFWIGFIISLTIYWSAVFITLWIIAGYSSKKKSNYE
tara:strand:- start:287 stop:523 length:237 start_codon:yes stop_codon:yes gene_type:complete